MSKFFNIRALAGTIIIEIYGVITEYEMFEEYLRWQISEMGENAPIAVRMNSPGGDPRVAMSMYRILKNHKGPTTCYIEYMCDSAAPCISSGCDKVIGNRFPFELMVHDPQMYTEWIGVEDGEAAVDMLAKIRDDMIRIFTEKTGQPEEVIRQMMKDTTFMNAQEALEFGFIDEIKDVEQTLYAKVDYKIAANAHKDVRPEEFINPGGGKSPATSNKKQTTGSIMSDSTSWLNKLRASFGLGDTADEADVVLSAKELKADLKAKTDEIGNLQSSIEEKDTEIETLKAEGDDLKQQLPSEEEEEEELNEQVEAELEAAVKNFKITAASKEGWAQQFSGNPTGLKAAMELIPENALKGKNEGVKKPKSRAAVNVSMSDQAKADLGIN